MSFLYTCCILNEIILLLCWLDGVNHSRFKHKDHVRIEIKMWRVGCHKYNTRYVKISLWNRVYSVWHLCLTDGSNIHCTLLIITFKTWIWSFLDNYFAESDAEMIKMVSSDRALRGISIGVYKLLKKTILRLSIHNTQH